MIVTTMQFNRTSPISGTRGIGQHPLTLELFSELNTWLQGVDGRKKSPREAKEILVDVSTFLYFCNSKTPEPSDLLETCNYLEYIKELESLKVGPDGITTKLFRMSLIIINLLL